MNLPSTNYPSARPTRQGSAVVVILALLGIMTLLVAANTRTVNWLRAEVRLVDQRQTARLAASTTNSAARPPAPTTPAP